MSCRLSMPAALAALLFASGAVAQEYVRIDMQIDVARPAAEVWAKVGDYCDIADWFPNFSCEITSGDGGMGTVRSLAGGRIIEILVGKTDLSYVYTQPAVEGRFYDLYHGQLEARPVTANTILTAAPIPTEINGFTCGSVVLKLFAAMNDEKHAGGNAASASKNMRMPASLSPSTTFISPVVS